MDSYAGTRLPICFHCLVICVALLSSGVGLLRGAAAAPLSAMDNPGAEGSLQNTPQRLSDLRQTPWFDGQALSANARELLTALTQSVRHGLTPERYAGQNLHKLSAQPIAAHVAASDTVPARDRRDALARQLDDAFVQLATDLGRGVIDGRQVQRPFFRETPAVDVDLLHARLTSGELGVAEALDSITQKHPMYLRLQSALGTLIAERRSGRHRTRVVAERTWQVGDRHPDLVTLKHRLIELALLPADTLLTPRFDAPTLLAVRTVQAQHGLLTHGRLDTATRAVLNRSVDDDIAAVALSLERWRWMPRDLGERHLLVNLPNFRLEMYNGVQRIVDTPVVIGAVQHKTPVFSELMRYIEISPTWTVPRSIAESKLLPRELAEPGYLAARDFRFLAWSDGRLERLEEVSLDEQLLRTRPFPYLLQQPPGDENALGRVKFMLPNPHAIYLHDTPARALFDNPVRAYSHGCIRVSDPSRLASLILQTDGLSKAEASRLITRTTTKRVVLRTPLPTHIAYFTTWVDQAGRLQHRPDIYEQDATLRAALLGAESLLVRLDIEPSS